MRALRVWKHRWKLECKRLEFGGCKFVKRGGCKLLERS